MPKAEVVERTFREAACEGAAMMVRCCAGVGRRSDGLLGVLDNGISF